MIRTALALALLASPALADRPPVAYPWFLGMVVCTDTACETKYRPVYVESATACTTTSIMLLQMVEPGETVEEWWCE
jgi:hypothetical protein